MNEPVHSNSALIHEWSKFMDGINNDLSKYIDLWERQQVRHLIISLKGLLNDLRWHYDTPSVTQIFHNTFPGVKRACLVVDDGLRGMNAGNARVGQPL